MARTRFRVYLLYLGFKLGFLTLLLYTFGALFFQFTDVLAYRVVAVFLLIIMLSNILAKVAVQTIEQYDKTLA